MADVRSLAAKNVYPIVPTLYLNWDGDLVHSKTSEVVEGKAAVEVGSSWSVLGEILVMAPLSKAAAGDGSGSGNIHDKFDAIVAKLNLISKVRVGYGAITSEAEVDRALSLLDSGIVSLTVPFFGSNERILKDIPGERLVMLVQVLDEEDGEENLLVATYVYGSAAEKSAVLLEEAMESAKKFSTSIHINFVKKQGTCQGVNNKGQVEKIAALAKKVGIERLIISGGIASGAEIKSLDSLGIESSISTAFLEDRLHLGDALSAVLVSDRIDRLFTTVVVDECLVSLGLCYSNVESIKKAIEDRRGVYWSRSRNELWVKGATSGDTQELVGINVDCDRDALRFVVRQNGSGFCHAGTRTCFGEDSETIGALMRTLLSRREQAPAGSYTRRLLDDPSLLKAKLIEEVNELLEATTPEDVAWETADVIYFALTACARHGVTLDQVQNSLQRRTLRVRRRPGNAKPLYTPT